LETAAMSRADLTLPVRRTPIVSTSVRFPPKNGGLTIICASGRLTVD